MLICPIKNSNITIEKEKIVSQMPEILSAFNRAEDPYLTLKARVNTTIVAPLTGTVTTSNDVHGGQYVEIKNKEFSVLVCGLSKVMLDKNYVQAGDVIGLGNKEVKLALVYKEQYINPYPFIMWYIGAGDDIINYNGMNKTAINNSLKDK